MTLTCGITGREKQLALKRFRNEPVRAAENKVKQNFKSVMNCQQLNVLRIDFQGGMEHSIH